jgi:hypothetical protein
MIEINARIIQHGEIFSLPPGIFFDLLPRLVEKSLPEGFNSGIKC